MDFSREHFAARDADINAVLSRARDITLWQLVCRAWEDGYRRAQSAGRDEAAKAYLAGASHLAELADVSK